MGLGVFCLCFSPFLKWQRCESWNKSYLLETRSCIGLVGARREAPQLICSAAILRAEMMQRFGLPCAKVQAPSLFPYCCNLGIITGMLLLLTWLCSGVLAVKLRLSQIHFKPGRRVLAEAFTSAHPDPFQDCSQWNINPGTRDEMWAQGHGCSWQMGPHSTHFEVLPWHSS